ncbi:MAG: histidine phosphatase family protein [Armatimonadota bacterium]
MDIYLIRHGQSTGNGRQCFMGWSDHPLTDIGRAQAAAVARRLAPLGPMPVYCSDLQRACDTAGAIAQQWGRQPLPDPRWREVHCGCYEDKPWSDFQQAPELTAQFDADPLGTCMPDGESVAQMCARVITAFTELLTLAEPRIAVVTHDGPLRAVLSHYLQIPPERFWTLKTEHGGLTRLEVSEEWVSVSSVNETSHLPL